MARLAEQPVKSRKNEYQGPNAHLLSLQQTPRPDAEMWHSFHNEYIASITFALNERLPEGYTAYGDQSLQVELEWPGIVEKRPLRILDVSTYREPTYQATAQAKVNIGISQPSLVFPLREYDFDAEVDAVVIYKDVEHSDLGQPVARIELLSPSNKYGKGLRSYLKGRTDALRSGSVLYEIDLLHETPPPFDEIPVYPAQKESFPYYVVVTDPRQVVPETLVKGFYVADPFPLINIVLLGEDMVTDFDLGIPYNEAFQRGRWDKRVDYAAAPDPDRQRVMKEKRSRDVPLAIETYGPVDQDRIRARMREVVAAQASP